MTGGVLLAAALAALLAVANALRPPRVAVLAVPAWFTAWLTIELAWHLLVLGAVAVAALIAAGALDSTLGLIALVPAAAAFGALLAIALRSRRTLVQVRGALEELEPDHDGAPRYPRSHLVVPPLVFLHRGVRVERGITYARHGGRRQKLDAFVPKRAAGGQRPALVYLHGGGWITGTRREQGLPLLGHMARQGWAGFNVGYRTSPAATWPEHVVDVKAAIAWVRENAGRFGVDPSFVAVAGGSAGGQLAALAALTAGDPEFQPGFEDADTSVQAAVPFYGVYDLTNEEGVYAPEIVSWVLEPWVFKTRLRDDPGLWRRGSPMFRISPGAPPFMVVHGDRDSLVPVEDARLFAERLRDVSDSPVVYAEMLGAQHAFDVFPSARSVRVIEGIERFLTTTRDRRSAPEPEVERELAEELAG